MTDSEPQATGPQATGPQGKKSGVSLGRVAILLLPLAVVLLGSAWFAQRQFEESAKAEEASVVAKHLGIGKPTQNRLGPEYTDRDNDLVADPPTVEVKQITPETLAFSYVASADAERLKTVWEPLTNALREATGLPVEYLVVTDREEQLRALKEGRLHVAGLNTGSVPRAVNACGFVPVSTLARDDGSYGYTMQIIVPSDGEIKNVDDLGQPVAVGADTRKRRLTFTSPASNSGYKAPVVILMHDFGLNVLEDYDYAFSTSHSESIRQIAEGRIEAATVASDMVDRAVALDGVDADTFRAIYTSERFPPAALGYVYNLAPEIAEKVREVLVGFQFADTSLAEEFDPSGVTQLVAVDYKNDWSVIRRIDDTLGHVHTLDTEAKEEEAVASAEDAVSAEANSDASDEEADTGEADTGEADTEEATEEDANDEEASDESAAEDAASN